MFVNNCEVFNHAILIALEIWELLLCLRQFTSVAWGESKEGKQKWKQIQVIFLQDHRKKFTSTL